MPDYVRHGMGSRMIRFFFLRISLAPKWMHGILQNSLRWSFFNGYLRLNDKNTIKHKLGYLSSIVICSMVDCDSGKCASAEDVIVVFRDIVWSITYKMEVDWHEAKTNIRLVHVLDTTL